MSVGTSEDRGISPVLGALLIVAISVISLTLVGFFVFDFAELIAQSSETVAVDTHIATGNVKVEVTNGEAVRLLLVVNDTVEDVEPQVEPGVSLHASNVHAGAQVLVIAERDGRQDVISATRVLPEAGAPTSYETIGETGSLTVTTDGETDWTQLEFENTYESTPVVIAKPVSANDSDPVHVRVTNVTTTGATLQLEEWDYLDGQHGSETINYLVIETGNYTLEDGTRVEVRRKSQSGEAFVNREFGTSFTTTPVVFSQVQSDNGNWSVVTRNRDVTTSGFEVTMQEQTDSDGSAHSSETIGYVVVEPHRGLYRFRHEVDATGRVVTDDWQSIQFNNQYQADRVVLLDMQSFNESDPAALRYTAFASGSVDVFVEEELSDGTTSTDHAPEAVGYWVFHRDRDIIARSGG